MIYDMTMRVFFGCNVRIESVIVVLERRIVTALRVIETRPMQVVCFLWGSDISIDLDDCLFSMAHAVLNKNNEGSRK